MDEQMRLVIVSAASRHGFQLGEYEPEANGSDRFDADV